MAITQNSNNNNVTNDEMLSATQNTVVAIRDLNTALNTALVTPYLKQMVYSLTLTGAVIKSSTTLDSTAVTVLSGSTSRVSINFHNPGLVTLYVFPQMAFGGTTLAPTITSLNGAFEILPGAFLPIIDQSSGSWSAFASSGSSNPITIMVST